MATVPMFPASTLHAALAAAPLYVALNFTVGVDWPATTVMVCRVDGVICNPDVFDDPSPKSELPSMPVPPPSEGVTVPSSPPSAVGWNVDPECPDPQPPCAQPATRTMTSAARTRESEDLRMA